MKGLHCGKQAVGEQGRLGREEKPSSHLRPDKFVSFREETYYLLTFTRYKLFLSGNF